jgi:small subunit ribosomal protein S15
MIAAMALTKRVKSKIAGEFGKHEKDTGSAEVQVALLSRQIDELAAHLKKNPKDNHSRRGLLKMVSRRRKFLEYLRKHEPQLYAKVVKKLELKK